MARPFQHGPNEALELRQRSASNTVLMVIGLVKEAGQNDPSIDVAAVSRFIRYTHENLLTSSDRSVYLNIAVSALGDLAPPVDENMAGALGALLHEHVTLERAHANAGELRQRLDTWHKQKLARNGVSMYVDTEIPIYGGLHSFLKTQGINVADHLHELVKASNNYAEELAADFKFHLPVFTDRWQKRVQAAQTVFEQFVDDQPAVQSAKAKVVELLDLTPWQQRRQALGDNVALIRQLKSEADDWVRAEAQLAEAEPYWQQFFASVVGQQVAEGFDLPDDALEAGAKIAGIALGAEYQSQYPLYQSHSFDR